MNRSYYYFIASLPLINFGSEPPLSVEEFLNDCRRLLAEDDYTLIEKILTGDELPTSSGNQTFDAWARFIKQFQNEQARFRAERAGRDPREFIRGEYISDSYLSETIQQALKEETPLDSQEFLDTFIWKFLDELETKNIFTFGAVIAYGLKLKILERYAAIRSPKGQELFKEIEKIKIPLNI